MLIQNLKLYNFRSFNSFSSDFSPVTTIIIGNNAAGKTNILEAVYMLSSGKSFRDVKDYEAVNFSAELGRISADVIREGVKGETEESLHLETAITKGEVMGVKTRYKKCMVNGVSKRVVDFAGNLKAVLFWPQDMDLVSGSPSLRRKYLDYVISQTDREYRRCLASYEKGVRQRNRVLERIRDEGANSSQLIFWDQLVIKNGEYLTRKREEYITYVNNSQFNTSNSKISKGFPFYNLVYDRSLISRQRLDQYKEAEVAAGVTLVGPHRDDFEFRIQNTEISTEGRNLAHFGSRGEQRLAVLWLKIQELEYIMNTTSIKPVLLLDDIFSELDHPHRDIIFQLLGKQQTIMTTTDENFIPDPGKENVKIVRIT